MSQSVIRRETHACPSDFNLYTVIERSSKRLFIITAMCLIIACARNVCSVCMLHPACLLNSSIFLEMTFLRNWKTTFLKITFLRNWKITFLKITFLRNWKITFLKIIVAATTCPTWTAEMRVWNPACLNLPHGPLPNDVGDSSHWKITFLEMTFLRNWKTTFLKITFVQLSTCW